MVLDESSLETSHLRLDSASCPACVSAFQSFVSQAGQNGYVMTLVDVLTHPYILRRRAAGN